MSAKTSAVVTEKAVSFGYVAEFDSPGKVLHAVEKLFDKGYTKVESYSPFPIHGMDKAMRLPTSRLTFIVFVCALLGGGGALYLQYWTSAVDYPLVISGKPFASWAAFIPVTFELTILLSAFGTVFGMFFLNRLPSWNDPVFNHSKFDRVSLDGFFVSIEAADPKFNTNETKSLLAELGGKNIEWVDA